MSLRENTKLARTRIDDLNDPSFVFKNPQQLGFIRTMVDVLRDLLTSCVTTKSAAPFILLQSPDGTVYKVEVDDTGTLVTSNARAP